MGAGESTQQQEPSSNYDVKEGRGDGVLELPPDLQQGPVHSLTVADRHHLLSGGADKVSYSQKLLDQVDGVNLILA